MADHAGHGQARRRRSPRRSSRRRLQFGSRMIACRPTSLKAICMGECRWVWRWGCTRRPSRGRTSAQCERLHPAHGAAADRTAAARCPGARTSSFCARTMSGTVTTGKRGRTGRPVSGSTLAGPVLPLQPAMTLEQMTKYLVGVEGAARADHHVPPPRHGRRRDGSRPRGRRRDRAWRMRMALERVLVELAVGLVGDASGDPASGLSRAEGGGIRRTGSQPSRQSLRTCHRSDSRSCA